MMLPLVLAALLFHRYSPDKVKAASINTRATLWVFVNRLLTPATRLVRPLFALAARLPGFMGQALADAALTLTASPAGLVAMLVILVFGALAPQASLPGVLTAAVVCWGIVISDLAVRDFQSATESMSAAVRGGATQRYARQLVVTFALGLLCTSTVLLRWLAGAPFRALVLVSGLFALSAAASLLGRLTRTGRTFLALFLFGVYLAVNVREVAWFDVIGFNGVANAQSVAAQLVFGLAACIFGYIYNQRKANA